MSTLKVEQIQHPDSSTPAITLDSTGAMSGSFPYPNRNLLYNGGCVVAQRGTSASFSSAGYYTADRWNIGGGFYGSWTQSVENDAPDGTGLSKSIKMLCTTAGTGSLLTLGQRLEGQDVQRLCYGTSQAKQFVFSFWIKSNVTGTYVIEAYNLDNGRHVGKNFTIDSVDTWEKKVVVIDGDQQYGFDNDNNSSFIVWLTYGASSAYTSGSLPLTWSTVVNQNRAAGLNVNLADTVGNYIQTTGWQLEEGSVATPFEHRSFGDELARCQRYYYKTFNQETVPAQNAGLAGALGGSSAVVNVSFTSTLTFPVAMRATPTITTFDPTSAAANWSDQSGYKPTATVLGLTGQNQVSIRATGAIAAGGAHSIHVTANAEL